MKFCKCQNLNSLFREIIFLELPKYSRNLPMLSIIEKFKNWKTKKLKNWYAFLAGEVEKLAPFLTR